MNYFYRRLLVLVISILIITCPTVGPGVPIFGPGGLQAEELLNMVTPAESIGFGNCFVANSYGVNSIWLNPAGLSTGFANQYSIGGARWIGNINLFTGSAVIPFPFGNIGAGVGWLGMPSENYENEIGETTGETLNFDNILINIGYGREFFDIPVGINLKFVKSSIGLPENDKTLILSDIGLMYSIWQLNLGLMLRNFGINAHDTGDWGEIRTGVSWQVLSQKIIGLKLLCDYYTSATYESGINGGAELGLFRIAALRAGYSSDSFNKLKFGIGFKLNIATWHLQLDYGINPFFKDSEMTSHFIQITVNSRVKELEQKTRAFVKKAENYMESENYAKAEREMEKALKVNPEDKELIALKNEILTKKNEKKAEPHFKKAVESIRIKNYEKAKKELIVVVELTPNNKDAHLELGKIYYIHGNYKISMDYLQNALNIDKDFEAAKKMQAKIINKVEKTKPKWIKEDKYYTKARLVFEDFQQEALLPKFVADQGKFKIKKEGDNGFGEWKVKLEGKEEERKEKVLRTAIRLPDLAKFKGILISIKSDDIEEIKIVLVEQSLKAQDLWTVPISGIEDEWKDIKVPFHYFQLLGRPKATIDLSKISQIRFNIGKDKEGELYIDNLELYQ